MGLWYSAKDAITSPGLRATPGFRKKLGRLPLAGVGDIVAAMLGSTGGDCPGLQNSGVSGHLVGLVNFGVPADWPGLLREVWAAASGSRRLSTSTLLVKAGDCN